MMNLKSCVRFPTVVAAFSVLTIIAVTATVGLTAAKTSGFEKPLCTTCHVSEHFYQSLGNNDRLASKHAKGNFSCEKCHKFSTERKIEKAVNYVTGNYTDPLPKGEKSSKFCIKCHKLNKVKVKTDFGHGQNPHDAHISGELQCTDCHSMHRKSELACNGCHNFKWKNTLDASWAKNTDKQ